MAYNDPFVRLLFLLTFLSELAVLIVAYRRRMYRTVPWFFTYLVYVTSGIALVSYPLYELDRTHNVYYKASWMVAAGAMVLSFLFIVEAFRKVMSSYESIRALGTSLLIISGMVLAIFTLLTVKMGADHSVYIARVILVTERSVRIVQVGVIVVFFAFSRFLALSWRHYLFGIVFPFGLYACANLAIAAFGAQKGGIVGFRTMWIDGIAYVCMYLLWLKYFLQPDPKGPSELPPSARDDLERWDGALSGMAIGRKR